MSDNQSGSATYAGRPGLCRNCGALVGAGEKSCAQCGAPLKTGAGESAGQTPVYDRETMRFLRAILQRPATFTFIFLIINIFLLLLTALSAHGTGNEAEFNVTLIEYGAKVNALINAGQWWRFVTPIFLHGGFVHLLMNMYGLWILGPYVERLYGSAKFVVFWVVTGVAGVLASYLTVRPGMHAAGPVGRFLFKSEDVASVGASGALFGLIGVLFVFGIKFRHELPEGFKRAFGTGMLPTILLNIFIGYAFPFIDNAAHMGGLVAGATLALFVGYKRPGEPPSVAIFWHILQVAALALVAVSFVEVALHFQGNPPTFDKASVSDLLPNGGPSNVEAYVKAINQGHVATVSALNGDASGVDQAITALEDAPHLDEKADAIRDELKSLLERARAYAALSPQERKKRPAQAQLRELVAGVQTWRKNRDQWIQSEGQKYGIEVKEEESEKDSQDVK